MAAIMIAIKNTTAFILPFKRKLDNIQTIPATTKSLPPKRCVFLHETSLERVQGVFIP